MRRRMVHDGGFVGPRGAPVGEGGQLSLEIFNDRDG